MARVLYLSASNRIGGAEESLLTLFAALDRKQFEPVLGIAMEASSTGSTLSGRAATLGIETV